MDDLKILNDRVLIYFECVVCTEYMHPPIVQCIEGHSVCNRCHNKLGRCPTCRQKFNIGCRPVVLERLHQKLIFPCKFHEQGCNKHLLGEHILKHEASCEHRIAVPEEIVHEMRCGLHGVALNDGVETHVVTRYLSMLEELAGLVQY